MCLIIIYTKSSRIFWKEEYFCFHEGSVRIKCSGYMLHMTSWKVFPRLASSLELCDTGLTFYIMTARIAIEGSGNSENQFYTWIASNNLEVTVISLKSVPAKSPQLCSPLCNPVNCSPPGSSVHRILQARILEWVAMPTSRGSS